MIVAAGVTGSVIAIPLLSATGASAAEASTWDHVAECESGGMWSADLGNGYYGGLQLSQETWDSFGGDVYADRPDLASRSQQIKVAEKVLEAQGPSAWTSCSVISGLVGSTGEPNVDPGSGSDPAAEDQALAGVSADNSGGMDGGTGSVAPKSTDTTASSSSTEDASGVPSTTTQAPDASSTPAGKASATPSTTSTTSTTPSASSASATSTVSANSTTATGSTPSKHRGAAASETEQSGNSVQKQETGRHASRGDASVSDAKGDGISDDQYTVRAGDNLWDIAVELSVPGGWQEIYAANKATVGADPDLILPGQSLDVGAR